MFIDPCLLQDSALSAHSDLGVLAGGLEGCGGGSLLSPGVGRAWRILKRRRHNVLGLAFVVALEALHSELLVMRRYPLPAGFAVRIKMWNYGLRNLNVM